MTTAQFVISEAVFLSKNGFRDRCKVY